MTTTESKHLEFNFLSPIKPKKTFQQHVCTTNSPWVSLVGRVRGSLGLGGRSHGRRVVGGRSDGRHGGRGGGRRLGSEGGRGRPGRGAAGLVGGLLVLSGRSHRDLRQCYVGATGVASVMLLCVSIYYKDGPGCRCRARGGARDHRGALIGWHAEGRSAGLAGDALLQLSKDKIK